MESATSGSVVLSNGTIPPQYISGEAINALMVSTRSMAVVCFVIPAYALASLANFLFSSTMSTSPRLRRFLWMALFLCALGSLVFFVDISRLLLHPYIVDSTCGPLRAAILGVYSIPRECIGEFCEEATRHSIANRSFFLRQLLSFVRKDAPGTGSLMSLSADAYAIFRIVSAIKSVVIIGTFYQLVSLCYDLNGNNKIRALELVILTDIVWSVYCASYSESGYARVIMSLIVHAGFNAVISLLSVLLRRSKGAQSLVSLILRACEMYLYHVSCISS